MDRVRKVVFPVAGLGTRFLPATKALPKEMLPVVDKPLIQYAVEEAAAAGCDTFIFVTAPGKEAIEKHFQPAPALRAELEAKGKADLLALLEATVPPGGAFHYVIQDAPRGLGHAIWCAKALIGAEPFAVILPDEFLHAPTPGLKQLTDAAARTGASMVGVLEVEPAQTKRYGIVAPGPAEADLIAVRGLVEKPAPAEAPSRLAVIGRYVLAPAVFDHLDRFQAGAGGEIQLTDAIASLIGTKPLFARVFEGERFDCGDKLGFLEANLALGLERTDLGADRAQRLGALLARADRLGE